jgi:spore maturation protein CgeB
MSNGSKIKVLLTYLVFPLAMATYFRKALQNRDDVDLKVAGIYTGSWIPWLGGMNLPEKYAIPPDVSLSFSLHINEYPYEEVTKRLGDWTPDLIIQVDAGFHAKYRPTSGMVVTVGTDPHVLNDFYDVPRKYSDKFFNMQAVYSKDKDIYLPYAYSKYDFYPIHIDGLEDGTWKDKDAVLIGMPYEQRVQWVNELRKRDVSVIFENGPVFDEARALYNRGRIGLNWSSLDDLNCRAFELPAMKLAPVMNLVSDVGRFFDQGTHYLGFKSLPEAVEQVVWLKENPFVAQQMAERAYQNVLPHTYDARVTQILKETGFVV